MSTKTLHITDESQSVTKTIVLLAWPVFLEQIFTTLVSYADTAMVGSLGAWALFHTIILYHLKPTHCQAIYINL